MTIALALSGGADSLFSLAVLKEQRDEKIIGIHAFFLPPTPKDHAKAQALEEQCRALHVPFVAIDLSSSFEKSIIQPFIRAYLRGQTPNPCAWCNRKIKFGLLLQAAQQQGATMLATGHYARIIETPCGPGLFRGEDPSKDQSYFLSLVPFQVWKQILFPLGTRHKTNVLSELSARNLSPVESQESQEICFIPDNYRTFLQMRGVALPGPGPVTTVQGKVLGTHKGLWRYTQGQRRGLGIAYEYPLYVIGKDMATNTLRVGSQKEIWAAGCEAEILTLHVPVKEWPAELLVQTRFRQRAGDARGRMRDTYLSVEFITPQEVPTPGQVLAVYTQEGQVLAGGIITRPLTETIPR